MSKLETNTIDTVSGTSTLQVGSTNTTTITLGVSGDTINVPSGVTIANSGTATGFGENMTPAFEARNTGTQTGISSNTWTKMTLNSETYDTDNAFDSTTNYRFTPQTAGKYFFYAKSALQVSSYNDLRNGNVKFYKNGSEQNYTETRFTLYGNTTGGTGASPFISAVFDMNGSSDYVEAYLKIYGLNSTNQSAEYNLFGGYRIIT